MTVIPNIIVIAITATCSFALGWKFNSFVQDAVRNLMIRALISETGKKRLLEEVKKISERDGAA